MKCLSWGFAKVFSANTQTLFTGRLVASDTVIADGDGAWRTDRRALTSYARGSPDGLSPASSKQRRSLAPRDGRPFVAHDRCTEVATTNDPSVDEPSRAAPDR